VLAHGIHLQTEERQLIRQMGASIAHCANSNYSLDSGIMDVRQFLNEGLKIGLGTDVAGGYSASMLNAIREAIIASKSLAFSKWTEDGSASAAEYKPLSYEEAFYLATLGGAQAVGMSDRIGNFLVGKSFDALLIDATPDVQLRPFDVFEADFASDVFQKFIFLGDDRNIAEIYVSGKKLDKDALAVDA
jgi:guanine deaminase